MTRGCSLEHFAAVVVTLVKLAASVVSARRVIRWRKPCSVLDRRLALLLPCCMAAGCSPLITCTTTDAESIRREENARNVLVVTDKPF